MPIKLCKDCRFLEMLPTEVPSRLVDNLMKSRKCLHPKAERSIPDYVYGIDTYIKPLAQDARMVGGFCGGGASLFEPKKPESA